MVHVVPIDALGEDARDLPVLVHGVVRVFQSGEHAEVPQRFHDRHADEKPQEPGVGLLGSDHDRRVQTSERGSPCPAMAAPT